MLGAGNRDLEIAPTPPGAHAKELALIVRFLLPGI